MPRRISASQLRSTLQQAQNKQRQAIQRYNSKVRQYNTERKRQIDAYNQAVRSYNSRVRANRDRLQSALQRLSRQPATVRHTSLHQSFAVLSTAYEKLDGSDADPFLADLAKRETANSVSLLNLLLGDNDQTQETTTDLAATKIGNSLSTFSEDLQNRWLAQSLHSTLQTPTPLGTFVPAPEKLSLKCSIPRHRTRTSLPSFQIAR